MFDTMIVAGPMPDQVFVLIPDSISPTVDADSPVDLQHVVGLSLGSAVNLNSTLPPEGLHLALALQQVASSHIGPRTEVSPILRK